VSFKNLTPAGAYVFTAFALVGVGVLASTQLLSADYAKVVVAFLLGGGSGAALQANVPGGKK
jgi:hypothetical protein